MRNAQRPTVVDRWRLIREGQTQSASKAGEVVSLFVDDPPGGCLASLLPTERRRMAEVAAGLTKGGVTVQVDVQDVQHNPEYLDRTLKAGDPLFMCPIKRSGILVRHDLLREGRNLFWKRAFF